MVNGNIWRIALQPARQVARDRRDVVVVVVGEQQGQVVVDDLTMMATLMPSPRSLHDLWHEYQHGVGGRKAARLFSYTERGRSKHRYSRRKVVWDLVSGLVRQGIAVKTSIDKIYAVYGGQTSVTNIINALKGIRGMGLLIPI